MAMRLCQRGHAVPQPQLLLKGVPPATYCGTCLRWQVYVAQGVKMSEVEVATHLRRINVAARAEETARRAAVRDAARHELSRMTVTDEARLWLSSMDGAS